MPLLFYTLVVLLCVLNIQLLSAEHWSNYENQNSHDGGFLIPSLFSHTPPYVKFARIGDKFPPQLIPKGIRDYLRWGKASESIDIINGVLVNTGLRKIEQGGDSRLAIPWFGRWDKYPVSSFHTKKYEPVLTEEYQKYNRIPAVSRLSYKDQHWLNFKKLIENHGKENFSFLLSTFILPDEFEQFKVEWERQKKKIWILKPPKASMTKGIKLISHWSQARNLTKQIVIQKYVETPYLLNNKKVHLKVHAVITSVHPLRIYTYKYTRMYIYPDNYSTQIDNLKNACAHYAAVDPRECPTSSYITDGEFLFDELKAKGVDIISLKAKLQESVLFTILSDDKSLYKSAKSTLYNNYNSFQSLSFDFIIDAEFKPWLLETNSKPIMRSYTNDSFHPTLLSATLNLAGFNLPSTLPEKMRKTVSNILLKDFNKHVGASRTVFNPMYHSFIDYKRQKRNRALLREVEARRYDIRDILRNFTSNNLRVLMMTEDELERSLVYFDRVFPSPKMRKYFKYIESDLYYYKLLDTWESIDSCDRQCAITHLEILAASKVHLK